MPPAAPSASWTDDPFARPARVLFVTHEASRTGAVIALLRLVTWLRDNGIVEPQVLVRTKGELFSPDILSRFRELGPTRLVSPRLSRWRRALAHRAPPLLTAITDDLVQRWYRRHYRDVDLVWFNTSMNGPTHDDLRRLSAPTVCHVHELHGFIREFLPPEWRKSSQRNVDMWLAVSEPVALMLQEDFGVAPGSIRLLPGMIDPDMSRAAGAREKVRLPGQPLHVGAVGTPGRRKGTDLFVQVALELRRKGCAGKINLSWLGGRPQDNEYALLSLDVAAAGLQEIVTVLPNVADPGGFYSSLDVLLVPSREDPFPLVMLEAATFAVPVVAFAGSGGPATFAGWGAGITVDYLDAVAMADAVIDLLEDSARRARLGDTARQIVADRFRVDDLGALSAQVIADAVKMVKKSPPDRASSDPASR
jgi:glycosyltransferase involved in cell wall biosynthesis